MNNELTAEAESLGLNTFLLEKLNTVANVGHRAGKAVDPLASQVETALAHDGNPSPSPSAADPDRPGRGHKR